MRNQLIRLFWGSALILIGVVALLTNFNFLRGWSAPLWIIALIVVSALFFGTYFLSGVREWGWLFPACISAGVAATIALAEAGVRDSIVGVPVLASVGVPFVVAYILDRRQNWWALIPAWVMAVVAAITAIADRVPGEFIGAGVMFAIALPFLVVFLTDRSRWWALIPAFVLAAVGGLVLLTTVTDGELIGAFVMFAVAAPFVVVYLLSERNWWAILPAGIMASIGLAIAITGWRGFDLNRAAWMNGVMFLGWAATFAVLWLRPAAQPHRWAMYPAIGLALAGVLAVLLGANFQMYWPILLTAAGLLALFGALRPRGAH